MPLHVTDVSAPIDYCNTSDTAPTQMCFHDGSSFFPIMCVRLSLSLSRFFPVPQYAKDLLDKPG